MKKYIALLIGLAVTVSVTLHAQTNVAQVPNLLGASPSLSAALSQVVAAVENSDILNSTNYAFAPYLTYAPSAPAGNRIGGGVLAIYNVPSLNTTYAATNGSAGFGAALGVDYLGQFSLVSGNATIHIDTHPLAHIAILGFLPDSIKNVTVTQFALAGLGQPMSGGGAGAATIWDIGEVAKFGHWLGGNFGVGFTWGEWMNAGAYSGHRYHVFVEWQKGF